MVCSAKQLTKLLDKVALAYRMHRRGVNMRYMGRLRQQMACRGWRQVILSHALARVVKNDFREALRVTLRAKGTSDVAIQGLVANYLSTMLTACSHPEEAHEAEDGSHFDPYCAPPPGKSELQLRQELEVKFPGILTEEERTEPISDFLQKRVSPKLIIFECLNLKMFKLSPYLTKKIATTDDITSITISPWDVMELCTNVRFSLFTWFMKTLHIQMSGRKRLGDKTPLLISREYSIEVQQKNKEITFRQLREECHLYQDRERKKEALKEKKRAAKIAAGEKIEDDEEVVLNEEELVWQATDENNKPIEKELLKGARRCFKKAASVITVQQLNYYPLLPHLSLIWGDILQDIAKTHTTWEKINATYKSAYEKFATTQEISGPFKVQPSTLSSLNKTQLICCFLLFLVGFACVG